MKLNKDVVISNLKRTPFAQISKGLSSYESHEMALSVAEAMFKNNDGVKDAIDGVIMGEASSSQPNPARVISKLLGLADHIPGLTLANNCVSSLEAVADACRRVELDEGQLYLSLGGESLTNLPITIKGSRANKKTATLEKLLKFLPDDIPEGIKITDDLEEGLNGGLTTYGMHVTAEIVAQKYNISREISDKFAYQSYKRAYNATLEGKYKPYIVPMKNSISGEIMNADEAVLLRKGIVENAGRLDKAMLLFENPIMKFDDFKKKYSSHVDKAHGPTVTIFNACPRSDGASGVFVSNAEKAKSLGLEAQARILGFRMKGVDPNLMGIGQAEATLALLEDLNLKIDEIDQIEIHEAFAATAIGALEEIKNQTSFNWEKNFEEGKINTYGGSISIGHPFGATGIRLLGNALMNLEHKKDINRVLITACASGGVAGAMLVERI